MKLYLSRVWHYFLIQWRHSCVCQYWMTITLILCLSILDSRHGHTLKLQFYLYELQWTVMFSFLNILYKTNWPDLNLICKMIKETIQPSTRNIFWAWLYRSPSHSFLKRYYRIVPANLPGPTPHQLHEVCHSGNTFDTSTLYCGYLEWKLNSMSKDLVILALISR